MRKLSKKFIIPALLLTLLGIGLSVYHPFSSQALSGSDFHAGRIIDDSIFFNPNTMSATDIQNFLNSKVPVCDTNGTQTSEFGGGTRAQYGTSRGYPPPYTCLKDYSQSIPSMPADAYCTGAISGGAKSAAQIIKDVATACSINPQVLLVLLQKEQILVTDTWPFSIQYTEATGFACPDTSSCDPTYAGFFNQVYYGARQYQKYAKLASSYNYQANQTENILYNPNAACGSSAVYIQNQATAGLYNYTPYQPNAAALNNLYGTGDSCSAYGNRNFWRLFNDWFGPTTNDGSVWGTIWNNSNLYLVVGRTYYYVPGPSIENAWGLENYTPLNNDPNIDPASYLASLTAGPSLGYVALGSDGTRYMMDGGKKYRLADDAHVLAWGMAGDAAEGIYAVGLLGLAPAGGDAGSYGVSSTSGNVYLMNGVSKHPGLNGQSLSYWGYSAGNGTTVTDDILNRMPTGPAVDRYINVGGQDEIVDSADILQFRNSSVENGWGSHTYVSIAPYAAALLPTVSGVGTFVRANNDANWYFLEAGNKHYVGTTSIASIWGWCNSNPLTVISPALLAGFSTASDLGYLAYSTSTGNHYIVDGSKHWIPGPAVAALYEGSQTVPGFSAASLSLLPDGAYANVDVVGFQGDPRVFTLDKGTLRYIPDLNTLDAFGGYKNPILTFSSLLDGMLSIGTDASFIMKDSGGNAYYLESTSLYSISSSFANTWQTASAPIFDSSTMAVFTNTGQTIKQALSVNGRRYIVNNRTLLDVTNDYQNYGLATTDFVNVSRTYFPTIGSSHLVGTPGNNKIWLLSMGQRYHIPDFGLLLDLGYSSNAGIVSLNPDIIATLPESASTANHLIRSPNSGVIFAMHGSGYGFMDGNTLDSYCGNCTVLVEPQSVFQKFNFSGWTSQIVYGTDGKLYYISSGQKHWITNPSLLFTSYAGIKWMSMPQYTIDSLPTGANISS